MDAHYNFRILRACLRPLVFNNLQLFGLCEHLMHKYPRFRKFSPFVSRFSSESEHDRRMIAIAFLFVRLLYDCFKSATGGCKPKYWYCGISSMLCSSEHHVDCICVGPTVPCSFCLSSLSRILDTITIVRSETVVRWLNMMSVTLPSAEQALPR